MDYPKSVPGIGLVNGKFADEDAATGRVGSLIPSAWGNGLTDEALAVISHAGLAPSEVDLTQLLQAVLAVQRGSTGGVYAVDTGAANAYLVAYTPDVKALSDGMVLRFRAKTANTAASTLAVNGLAAKPILGSAHAALAGGEIVAGGVCDVVWNGPLASWVLRSCTGGALQVGAPPQFDSSTKVATMAAVQRALGSLRGYQVYTSATTLTANDVGKLVVTASSAFTLTLPNPTVVPAGTALWIQNDNANTVTLSTPASTFFGAVGTGTATFAMFPAEFVMLICDGASWRIEWSASRTQTQVAGTNDARSATTAFVQAAIATALSSAASLGVGQTWQNLTASRAANTTYTNATGRTIAISVMSGGGPMAGQYYILVGGVQAAQMPWSSSSSPAGSMAAIIPPGATYSVTSGTPITYWSELR